MGKYRIKSVKYRDYSIHDEGDIRSIDIIELEPLDQESDICNKDEPSITEPMKKLTDEWIDKHCCVEPKEETLEEKFYNHLKSGFLRFYNSEDKEVQKETARRSAKIAKEHFQKKPEEIGVTEYWKEKCAILEEEREKWWSKADKPDDIYFTQDALTGRVSLDKINKIVFQDSKSLFYFNRWWVDKDSIRKALKEMKC